MIQINPLKSYIDGGVRAALTTPPSASLVFDLPGKAIWVKGVKLKGTDHTYTFSHDNYITLTNTPDSNESEDIKIGVNTSALKSAIDTTYGVVSTTTNGLAPKFTSGNKLAASAATTYYFLGWAGSTLKWYQAPFRNIRINSETTDCLGVNNTDPLIIGSGNGISVTWDSTNKKIIITNTKPDVNHNTHYTTMLYIGENNDTKANKNVANPYLKLFDDNTRRATFQIKAGSGIAVASDANGNITITNSSPDVNHNTDYRVTQSETTTANYRPLVVGYTNVNTAGSGMTGSVTNQVYVSNKFYVQPSTGNLYATTFVGTLFGNASSATKLQTPRTIWGQNFDGTRDIPISVPAKMPLVFFKRFDNDESAGYVGRGSSSNNNIYIESYVNANIILYGNNIGIGTYNPSEKLQVNGNIYSTGDVKIGGAIRDASNNWLLGGTADGTTSLGSTNFSGIREIVNRNGKFALNANGDTIISTSSKFGIAYANSTEIYNYFEGGSKLQLHVGSWTSNRSNEYVFRILAFNGGAGEIPALSVAFNGNVGINNSYPEERLSVGGNIFATGGFKKNGSNDNYVLLGGGGHKVLSDFSISEHNHDDRYIRKWYGVYGIANKFLKISISDEKGWIRLEVSDSNNGLSGGYGIYIIGWGWHGNNGTDNLFARCLYANDSRYTTALKIVRTSRNNYDFYFLFIADASYPSYTINYSKSVTSIDYTVTEVTTIPTATWISSLSALLLNASQVDWSGITNKPLAFNPTAHTHTVFNNNLMIKGTNGISDSASIHLGIGDSDTGFKWISDGKCLIYANNTAIGEWTSGGMNWFKNPTVNGNKVWNAGNDGSGSGLDSDTVDGLHATNLVRFYLSPLGNDAPADSAKSWFINTMPSGSGAIVYNVPGAEKTIIAGKSSGAFGHMLQLNYNDTYLRILRYYNGSWKSTDWEKISAGYADSAGNADTVDGQHFNWNNNKNDHTYLWAASSSGQAYLVHRASISVNYANSADRASYLSGHGVSPNNSHPGHGARVFYSWNIGQVGNDTSGYSNGITIGSHPSDTAYGFLIVLNMWDDRTYTRRYNGGWQSWKTLAWTSDIPTVTNYYWANVKVSASSSTSTSPTFGSLWINNSYFFKLSGTTFTCQGGTTFTLPSSNINTNTALLWTTASDGARDTGIFYNSSDFAFIANSNDHGAVFAVYDTDVTQDFEAGAREISVPGSGGALWARGGFSKSGSSNDYVLLGGGGHKAISDFSMSHSHPYLPLAGGTMTGLIQRAGQGSSWIKGRDNAMIRVNSRNGYSVLSSIKTTNGSWEIGHYDASGYNNNLLFGYYTDSDYSANNNNGRTKVTFTSNGQVTAAQFNGALNGNAATASYTPSAGNADTLDGYHASAFATAGHNHFTRLSGTNIDTELGNMTNWHYEISNATGTLPFTETWRLVYVMGGGDANYTTQISTGLTTNTALYFRHRRSGSWDAWRTILDSVNYASYALPLSGGTMTTGARISHENGNLYLGRADNNGWVMCQDLCSQTASGDTYWSLRTNGTFHALTTCIGGHLWLNKQNTGSSTGGASLLIFGNNGTLHVVISSNTGAIVINPSTSSSTGLIVLRVGTSTTSNFAGNINAAHFYENSDIRYKRILRNISINSNTIANLPLFDFEWIENNTIGTGTSALAVLLILPNLVSGTDKLTLDYGVLGTIAGITACKELVKVNFEIFTLKSEIEQLKEKVKLLEDRLRKYENI